MHLTNLLSFSLAVLSAVAAATAPAPGLVQDPDPSDILFEWEADLITETENPAASSGAPFAPPKIGRITYSGSGCRQGSKTPPLRTGGGWRDLGFVLPDFVVSYGAGGGPAASTVNCQAHVDLVAGAPGWQVGIRDVWSRGRAELDPGVTLKQFVTVFYSQDAANTVSAVQTVESGPDRPLKRDIELHSVIPRENIVWSKCTRADGVVGLLNVNFRAALTSSSPSTGKNAHGYFGGGRNSTVTEKWGWVWRRC